MSSGLSTWLSGSGYGELGVRETNVGDALGPRYEVLSFIGAGTTACVLKVADLSADREVRAAKLAPLVGRDQLLDPREAARAEFALASRFNHPNLVRYFDLDIPPEGPFALTTMEFVDGVPFGPGAAQRGTATVCELMVELLRGLAFLHDAGFVHGDVKPSNVLCGVAAGRPWAKLLDFHLMLKAADAARSSARGTLRYMAPEVIAGRAPEARSDLYSAGVVFYEALTGQALFEGTPGEVAAKHLSAPTAQATGAGALGDVLERLLSKHPDGRYRNASEAIAALAAAAGGVWLAETQETLLGRVRSAPLVGMDDALGAVSESLRPPGPPAEPGKVAVIRGRAGLGKSRFLRECQVRAQCAGLQAILLQGTRTAEALLGVLERSTGPREPVEAPARVAEDSPAFSVGMKDDPQDSAARLPAGLMRRCNGLADRLIELAKRRSVALFLDDVERMEPDAVECVLFLMRGTLRGGVAFGIAMPDAGHDAFAGALETWQREGLLIDIPLHELGREDRRRLIRSALPVGTPPTAVEALAESSGGLPDVIVLTLEHLIAGGVLSADAGGHMVASGDLAASLPEGLAQLTARVAESVDPRARRALRLLSAAGEVDAAVLAAAAGVEAGALDDMLRQGPVAPLVSFRRTDREVLCKLQHPRLADALLEGTPLRQVQALHDRLADAIEGREGADAGAVAVQSAKHRLQGHAPQRGVQGALALLGEESGKRPQDANLELARMALHRARGRARTGLLEIVGDLECARGRFSEAIGPLLTASRSARLAAGDRARLLRKLGSAYAEAGSYAKARRTLNRALAFCGAAQGPPTDESAAVTLLLARTDFHEAKYPAALEHYERARRLARELRDEHLEARALHGLGLVHLELRALRPSGLALLRAVRRSRKTGDQAEEAAAQAALGYLAMLNQDWQRATGIIEAALPALRAEGHLRQASRALICLGSVHQKLCAWEPAAEHYQNALAICERLGHPMGQATALVNLSQLNASRGWLEPAMAQAEQARRVLPGDTRTCCYAMNRLARAQYALGDLESARSTSAAAADLASTSGFPVLLESACRTSGEVAALRGDRHDAETRLMAALSLCRENHWKEREAVCLARSSELAVATGDLDRALSLAEEAQCKAEDLSQGSVRAIARMVKGKALLAKGAPLEAIPCLTEAEEVFQATRVWDDIVEVASFLGRAHAALGRLRFAALAYRQALETVEYVASHLRSPTNRALFLADPRRAGLFADAAALRLRTDGSKAN